MKKQEKYKLWMVIGLYIAIVLFILAIIALSKNIEEIRTDPIIYGMEKHDFDRCICSNPEGRLTDIVLEDHITINPGTE